MIGLGLTFEQTFLIFALVLSALVFIDVALIIATLLRNYTKKNKQKDSNSNKKEDSSDIDSEKSIIEKPEAPKKLTEPKPLILFFSRLKRVLAPVWEFKWIILNFILLILAGYLFNDLFVTPLNVTSQSHEYQGMWIDQENEFVIEFDRAFDPSKLGPEIYPVNRGKWVYEDNGIPLFKRTLRYIPQDSILPSEDIQIYIAQITNYYQTKPTWDKVIDLQSPRPAEIQSTYPENGHKDFGVNEEILFKLDNPDGKYFGWRATITPETEFELIRAIDPNVDFESRKELKVKFAKDLPQNTKYDITLERLNQTYLIETGEVLTTEDPVIANELSFTTIKAPSLSAIEPKGENVLVDSKIKINFDYPMPQEKTLNSIVIEPKIEYTANWSDEKTLELIPTKKLNKNTEFKVTVKKGLESLKGGVIEEDINHNFKTIGYVRVSGFSPLNNSTGRSLSSNISISFNQQVDKASAQSKFTISPNVSGNFSWDGNTMHFNPNGNLEYYTTYTVTVASGIKSIDGLDGNVTFTGKFTTEPKRFSLNLPYQRQPWRFACNVTSAAIALRHKGINRSPDSVYNGLPKDNTPWNSENNTWGNPYSGFVGNKNGAGDGPANAGGYGVYWGPIAGYISGQGRPAQAISGWNTTAMLREVEKGNPVIIWAHNGYGGSGTNISWTTPGGGYVPAVKGMHSYVVEGYIGSPENPSHVYVVDPGRGHRTMTISYFNYLWGTFNRSAVIVR